MYRFYQDWAEWWPLISPPEDYAEESQFLVGLLTMGTAPGSRVLELGSGGGHVASHLKGQFKMTLVDLSDEMLAISRRLNPECRHIAGDMRTLRLEEEFDAVLIYDAIDYMVEEWDLRAAIETAFLHCRPGGVALFVPDHVSETFETGADHGGADASDGRGVRYLEWTTDPDPADTYIRTDYAFLFRSSRGELTAVHETHVTGLFSQAAWLGLLSDAGFEPELIVEETNDDRTPRRLFRGKRPQD